MESICICEQGNRPVNQDRAARFSENGCGLYLVADGMGGHYAGEKASQTAVETFTAWWEEYLLAPQRPGFLQAAGQLREEIERCHRKIRQFAPPGQICGTTIVLLWINNGQYALFSIGDSRCYLISRRIISPQIIQITCDDIVRDTAPNGSGNAGKLLRALGVGEKCVCSSQTGALSPHTMFALCSDGVYKACPDRPWRKALLRASLGASLEKVGADIAKEIVRNGASDNYSLILIKA